MKIAWLSESMFYKIEYAILFCSKTQTITE
jgi:hypothetical protein